MRERRARRLAEERTATLARIESLSGQLDALLEAGALGGNDDEHDPEGVTVAFEREQVAGLLAGARADLGELELAGARLAAGDYGRCERCGGQIGEPRLDALPAARRCIRCAR